MALQSLTSLASITLQQEGASVSFIGIPQNYRDLILTISAKNSTVSAGGTFEIALNSDSASNYFWIYMFGSGSTQSTGTAQFTRIIGGRCPGASNPPSFSTFTFFEYSVSNKNKMTFSYGGSGVEGLIADSARWQSNSPINQIQVFGPGSASFAAGSTFSLYGRIA
jgi:hypothetical protein